MRYRISVGLSLLVILSLAFNTLGQSGRSRPGSGQEKKNQPPAASVPPSPEPTPGPPQRIEDQPGDEAQDEDAIKVDTNLITVPIVASDRDNRFLTDLRQDELEIYEDDKPQQIAFFATVNAPFNVILMLDTSASAEGKLYQIQRAAIAFVDQLQPADRIKVMSFDDKVHVLAEFTNERETLRQGINSARPGKGTKLYDAMESAINSFRRIEGRKAIVIFTDGVDSYSDKSSYDKNRKALEESGIIVYPIRYDTRMELEAKLRQQQQGGGATIDLGAILGGGGTRTTPGTFPGGTVPTLPPGTGATIGGIPIPPITIPTGTQRDPNDPNNQSRFPTGRNDPMGGYPQGGTGPTNSISAELDMLYRTADKYLEDLARITGGELNRADDLFSLPRAFERIAAELRTQYSLGYYPTNTARDGKFRKLRVKANRKGTVIRARPGYRAPQT